MWHVVLLDITPIRQIGTCVRDELTVWKSIDGGKSFTRVRVPHGDTHALWIDPKDGKRMINGNDGGGTVSLDGGITWSSIYNQPTAQFYHVITDNQWPYRIYGAQQDNTTISIPSRSDNGAIEESDWFPSPDARCPHRRRPARSETSRTAAAHGRLNRYDKRTGNSKDVSVWRATRRVWCRRSAAALSMDLSDRHLGARPHDAVRHVAVRLALAHRRAELGAHFTRLTVHDPATLGRTGGMNGEMTGAEWYGTIYAFIESPIKRGVLWAGSDDGLIHVSQDAGQTWQNVTPPNFGKFTRVSHIDAGRHDAAVAYVAANRYQQDDFTPYLWKTHDTERRGRASMTGFPWWVHAFAAGGCRQARAHLRRYRKPACTYRWTTASVGATAAQLPA